MNISGSVAACGVRKVQTASDTFTDTDGTLLTAHTMDIGPGWSDISNNFSISGNKAVSSDKTLNCVLRGSGILVNSFGASIDFAVEYVDTSNKADNIGIVIKLDTAGSRGIAVAYNRRNNNVDVIQGAYADTQWITYFNILSGLPAWGDATPLRLRVEVAGDIVNATLTHTNTATDYTGSVNISSISSGYDNYAGIIHHGDGVYTEHGMDNFEVWELK